MSITKTQWWRNKKDIQHIVIALSISREEESNPYVNRIEKKIEHFEVKENNATENINFLEQSHEH